MGGFKRELRKEERRFEIQSWAALFNPRVLMLDTNGPSKI